MPNYVTAVEVANFLNITLAGNTVVTSDNISSLQNPDQSIINDFIDRAEQYIDSKTVRTWKETTITDEIHPYDRHTRQHRYRRTRDRNFVARLKLLYGDVKDFDTSSGDKIEVMTDIGTYTDIVSSGSAGSTPGDGDWYLENTRGILYINDQIPIYSSEAFRITYRSGNNTTVPDDIKEATIMYAAMRILQNMPDVVIKSEGDSRIEYLSLMKRWREDIKDILSEYSRQTPARTFFLFG